MYEMCRQYTTKRFVEHERLHGKGLLKKSPEKVKATPLRGKPHKDNPPYPPLSGGYKKAKSPAEWVEGLCFFLPPDKGG